MNTKTADSPLTADRLDLTLKINEIFFSLQGESSTAGIPTAFIRLTGCPLRCQYCDTEYAFYEGEKQTIKSIIDYIKTYNTRYITVTGGEPLAQKNCLPLLSSLCDEGYQVSLETSGAMDVSETDPRVIKILDLKTPASKEMQKNRYENLQYLCKQDEVKFVLCDRDDYDWAKQQLQQYKLTDICEVLFSPSYTELSPTDLANWILEDQLAVRFQTQLHKNLWGDVKGK